MEMLNYRNIASAASFEIEEAYRQGKVTGLTVYVIVFGAVEDARNAAIAEEREACAQLAIELDHPGGKGPGHLSDGYEIAEAIRARGK